MAVRPSRHARWCSADRHLSASRSNPNTHLLFKWSDCLKQVKGRCSAVFPLNCWECISAFVCVSVWIWYEIAEEAINRAVTTLFVTFTGDVRLSFSLQLTQRLPTLTRFSEQFLLGLSQLTGFSGVLRLRCLNTFAINKIVVKLKCYRWRCWRLKWTAGVMTIHSERGITKTSWRFFQQPSQPCTENHNREPNSFNDKKVCASLKSFSG